MKSFGKIKFTNLDTLKDNFETELMGKAIILKQVLSPTDFAELHIVCVYLFQTSGREMLLKRKVDSGIFD